MDQPGLCGACAHARAIRTRTSVFWRCGRHDGEPERYLKYPRLPVVRCAGYAPTTSGDGAPS